MSKGQTALITGASSGIGKEIAREFASRHYSLILVARDRKRLEEVANDLHRRFLVQVEIEVCDLSDAGSLERLLGRFETEKRVIDILVNNAGVGLEGAFVETDWVDERRMLELNMISLVRLTKFFLPQMVERRSGKILQVASTAAFQPGPYLSLYFATKSFVLSFSEAISAELRGTGVTITALCPGPTRTQFEKNLAPDSQLFETGLPVAKAEDVAAYAFRALMKGKRVAIAGVINRVLATVSLLIPKGLTLLIMARIIGRSKKTSRPLHSKDFPAA